MKVRISISKNKYKYNGMSIERWNRFDTGNKGYDRKIKVKEGEEEEEGSRRSSKRNREKEEVNEEMGKEPV